MSGPRKGPAERISGVLTRELLGSPEADTAAVFQGENSPAANDWRSNIEMWLERKAAKRLEEEK